MLPRLRDLIVRAHRMGVKIVTGTDTGYGPNSLTRIGQEVDPLRRDGLHAAAGHSVGNTNQRRVAAARETAIGIVEVGFEADLIAVEQNPLEHIATCRIRCS